MPGAMQRLRLPQRVAPRAAAAQLCRVPSRPPMTDISEDAAMASGAPLPDLDDLMPLIHDELRAIARRQLRRESGRFTLETTDLVHEAYLRLTRDPRVTARGIEYLHAAIARAMREVLIDAARRRRAAKRGSGVAAEPLEEHAVRVEAYGEELLAIDLALDELEQRAPRAARVVECRYFGGLTVPETAEALGISARTVKSDWALARAFLYDTLRRDDP